MKTLLRRLFVVGLVLTQNSIADSKESIPQDALNALNHLPEKTISIDVVLGLGIMSSDSFRAIVSDQAKVNSAQESAYAALDPRVYVKGNLSDDQKKSSNEYFSPIRNPVTTDLDKTVTRSASVGITKALRSGTSITADITTSNTIVDFADPSPTPKPTASSITISGSKVEIYSAPPVVDKVKAKHFVETKGTLKISQNLWKDAFGYQLRKNIAAGELQSEAEQFTVLDAIDSWANQLIQVYYMTWLAKTQAIASEESLKRRRRLEKITLIKSKRGTSEKPDLLQVESSVLSSQADQQSNLHVLQEQWKSLVTTLKLPKDWMRIDPRIIPMKLDPISQLSQKTFVESSLEQCGKPGNFSDSTPKNNFSTRSLSLQLKAVQNRFDAAKNGLMPNLTLSAALNTHGINESFKDTIDESTAMNHPSWNVGLEFQMPLSRHAEKAAAMDLFSNLKKLESLHTKSRSDLDTQWINQCSNLNRLVQTRKILLDAKNKQEERARLEQKRFQIGRVQTLQVIQAEDEAMAAELSLSKLEADLRITAWKIKQLSSQMTPWLRAFTKLSGS